MAELPASILFACTLNQIRSPMAAALMRYLHGRRIYVQSAGVSRGEPDGFLIAVMDELGLDVARHAPQSFDDLEDSYFDLVVSLSPEAHHHAVELTRTNATEIEYWQVPDPSLVEGSREARLEAYRELRDKLLERLRERFPVVRPPEL